MNQAPIAPDQWQPFCEAFARSHHGWLTTLGITDTARLSRGRFAIRALARDAALTDLRLDRSERGGELVIVTGEGPTRSVHRIERPVALYLEEEGGHERGLRVDSAAGRTLLLEFGSSPLPEQRDDITGERSAG